MDLLEFEVEKDFYTHYWRKRVYDYLSGTVYISYEEAQNARNDRAGIWLRSAQMRHFKYLPEVKELRRTHDMFHEALTTIVKLKEAGNVEGAQEEFKKMDILFDLLVQVLGWTAEAVKQSA